MVVRPTLASKSDNLAERHEGEFQGLTREQQVERFPECFDGDSGRVNPESVPGAERLSDFLDRVGIGLREIRRLAETTGVLVVTHAGVLQALTSLISGEDYLQVSAQRPFGYCDVLRFDQTKIDIP